MLAPSSSAARLGREHISGFERQWRQTIPDEGRIGLEIERSNRALIISELRLTRASYEDIRWSRPFPQSSIVLMLCTFRLTTPAAFECKRVAIATLGIHTIARRFQRGFNNTDRAIQIDISELALNVSRLLDAEGQTFAIPCPSGQWVGAIETVSLSGGHDQRVLNVRSFLPDPQEKLRQPAGMFPRLQPVVDPVARPRRATR
jgi:hypothetical protein